MKQKTIFNPDSPVNKKFRVRQKKKKIIATSIELNATFDLSKLVKDQNEYFTRNDA